MSASTEQVKLDELEVKQTLASARKVLHVHRDWMRRRNPSISPLPPDDPLSFSPEKRPERAWDEEEAVTGVVSDVATSSDLSPTNRIGGGRDLELAVAETRGGAGSKGKWRPRSGKVAPAIVSDHHTVSPSQAWDEISRPLSAASSRSTFRNAGEQPNAGSAPNNAGKSTDDGRPRKRTRSRGAVVPLITSSDENNMSGSLRLCTTSPNSAPGSGGTSPPPAVHRGVIEAWSVSSSPGQDSNEYSTQESQVSHEKPNPSQRVVGRDSSLLSLASTSRQTLINIPEEMDSSEDDEELEQTDSRSERVGIPEQALENKQFLQELRSSSTATVVSIIPAPKHLRTSYARHKHSKIGIENDPDDSLNGKGGASVHDNDTEDGSLSHGGQTSTLDTKLFEIPQAIVLPVLPLEQERYRPATKHAISPAPQPTPHLSWPREQESSPEVATAALPQSHQSNVDTDKEVLIDSTRETPCVDQLHLEDIDEWIPPESRRQPQPKVVTAKQGITEARKSEVKDWQSKDKAQQSNSSPFQLCKKRKQPPQTRSGMRDNEALEQPSSLKILDVSMHESVIETSVRRRLLNSTADNHVSTSEEFEALANQQRNEHEPFPTSKPYTFTAVKEMSSKKKGQKFKLKSEQDHRDEPVAEGAHRKDEGSSSPVGKIKREQASLDEKVTADSPSMPLLRVKSTISLFIPGELAQRIPNMRLTSFRNSLSPYFSSLSDLSATRKRDRDLPDYSIHSPNGSAVLAPPCPLYGTVQPTDAECKRCLLQSCTHR